MADKSGLQLSVLKSDTDIIISKPSLSKNEVSISTVPYIGRKPANKVWYSCMTFVGEEICIEISSVLVLAALWHVRARLVRAFVPILPPYFLISVYRISQSQRATNLQTLMEDITVTSCIVQSLLIIRTSERDINLNSSVKRSDRAGQWSGN